MSDVVLQLLTALYGGLIAGSVSFLIQRHRLRHRALTEQLTSGPCYVCRLQRDDLQELLAPLQVCVPCGSDVFTEVEQAFAPWDYMKTGEVPQKREPAPAPLGPAAQALLEIGAACQKNGLGREFQQALAEAEEALALVGKPRGRSAKKTSPGSNKEWQRPIPGPGRTRVGP